MTTGKGIQKDKAGDLQGKKASNPRKTPGMKPEGTLTGHRGLQREDICGISAGAEVTQETCKEPITGSSA
ncbi:hypothetical protein DSO57_1011714 [Entomophthora muscae]|uniref:Uncharacterized protein n=1 Tax=Entomophthora muscae TaxID=34485 RepID=A0ACC2SJ45_9FUNG|nr:hypothetical protein DSO57_1011714 [Entomophthora muscae]